MCSIAIPRHVLKWVGCPILAASLLAITTTHAAATGGVSCSTKDGSAEIWISMGRVPIYSPFRAGASYGDRHWSSNPQDGEEQLGSSQGMIEGDNLSADFADENVEKIIMSLRVDSSGEEDESGFPGTLKFEDGVIHKVFCEFG